MKSQTSEVTRKITTEFYINLGDPSGIDFAVYDRRKYKIVFEGQGGYTQ